jgi:hypothetical protein
MTDEKKKRGRPPEGKEGSVFSFYAAKEILDTLEEAKWTLRKSKGNIVVEALQDYFKKHKIRMKKS